MKLQLLLLLALAGPFCSFTSASPTGLPLDTTEEIPVTAAVPEATEAAKEELVTLLTGPPATEPPAAPEQLATEVFTEAAPAVTVLTEEAVVETEAPVVSTAAAPEPLVTDAPVVVTEAQTEAAEVPEVPDVPAEATAAVETNEEVVVEEGSEDGLSSGQVVGIVIGALLAVVIVIAVVIAVVRRMGKYSP